MLGLAVTIARIAHAGQKYGEQDFYEAHLKKVAGIVERKQLPSEVVAVALLHDVLEDTAFTAEQLLALGVSPLVVREVQVLTRGKQEQYFDYIARIKAHGGIALQVKLADLEANSDPATVKAKLKPRYEKALQILGAA